MIILKESPYEKGVIDGDRGEPRLGIYEQSAGQQYEMGTKLVYGDGRVFRYAKNSSAATIVKASMTQAQVVETKTHEIVQDDYTIPLDATQIAMKITGSGTFVRNEFAAGWFFINKGTGIGDIYKVLASHQDFDSGGRGGGADDTIMHLLLETKIRTALTTASEASLIPSRWYDVVVFPATHTGYAAGVTLIDITALYYFWAQTGGPAPVLVDTGETVVIGNDVGSATSVAVTGACGPRVTLEQSWGNVMLVGAAAEPALIWLTLD